MSFLSPWFLAGLAVLTFLGSLSFPAAAMARPTAAKAAA